MSNQKTDSNQSKIISRGGFVMPSLLDLCADLAKYFKNEHPQLNMSMQELMGHVFSLTLKKLVAKNQLPEEVIQEPDFDKLIDKMEVYGIKNSQFSEYFKIAAMEISAELDEALSKQK